MTNDSYQALSFLQLFIYEILANTVFGCLHVFLPVLATQTKNSILAVAIVCLRQLGSPSFAGLLCTVNFVGLSCHMHVSPKLT